MPQRTATIGSASGLHARPAAVFTQAAAQCGHPVRIATVGGPEVDASSILMVMALGAGQGQEVVLTSDDEASGDALDALAAMLERDLDAEG